MEMYLALVHLAPLELHGDMADSEELHGVVDVLEHVLVTLRIANDDVHAHRDHS
jgi:hypothetical protein